MPNGRYRPTWVCPSCECHVKHLYRYGDWVCRQCADLTYESSQCAGNKGAEAALKVQRLEKKIGLTLADALPGVFDHFDLPSQPQPQSQAKPQTPSTPKHPKGRHRRTHNALVEALSEAQAHLEELKGKKTRAEQRLEKKLQKLNEGLKPMG
jgi:hypothetical protein